MHSGHGRFDMEAEEKVNKVEASGRTTEEALRAAAQQLGASVDELEYEVVEEGTKGFLGLGQTPTVIRAWTRQAARPPRETKAKEPPKRTVAGP